MNWGCENPVHNSLVVPSCNSNQEGHMSPMVGVGVGGGLWVAEDLSAVWLSHCMEITHLGELPGPAMNVV